MARYAIGLHPDIDDGQGLEGDPIVLHRRNARFKKAWAAVVAIVLGSCEWAKKSGGNYSPKEW